MFVLREAYRPRIAGRARTSVRVGAVAVEGTDLGTSYKDDFDGVWTYEVNESPWQIRAKTDRYAGGTSTPWFDRPKSGGDHDAVNAWIDAHAASLAVADLGGKETSEKSTSPVPSASAASSSRKDAAFLIFGMIGVGLIVWNLVN